MARGSEQWQALQNKHRILETVESDGFAVITANEINQTQADYPHLKFEARLLTHFDNAQQLPNLFKDNGLSILPIERGSYAIGRFNIFTKIGDSPDAIEVRTMPGKVDLFSLQEQNLANETMGMNYAFAHGITSDFAGEPLTATIAGRQKGGNWRYRIESNGRYLQLEVKNPQIEIDAGYEGSNSIVLVEAKNSLVEEFCLRQLYFPYRAWLSKSKEIGKQLRTFFAAINGSEVFLYEYVFPEPDLFKGQLVRSVRYQVASDLITKHELRALIDEIPIEEEPPDVPFPQADSIIRTMDVIEYLSTVLLGATKTELAEYYGFRDRQGLYYGNSARYLGYVDKVEDRFVANMAAYRYVKAKNKREKNLSIIKSMLKHLVFNHAIKRTFESGSVPDTEEIENMIMDTTIYGRTTAHRRASTVRNWVSWVFSVVG